MSDVQISVFLADENRYEEAQMVLIGYLAASAMIIGGSISVSVDHDEDDPSCQWLSARYDWEPDVSRFSDHEIDRAVDMVGAGGIMTMLGSCEIEVDEIMEEHAG